MAGHGSGQDDDDLSLDASESGVGVGEDGLDASARAGSGASGSGSGGGDARPISLLGLRLSDTQSPRDALVSRRSARPRPAGSHPTMPPSTAAPSTLPPSTAAPRPEATQPPGSGSGRATPTRPPHVVDDAPSADAPHSPGSTSLPAVPYSWLSPPRPGDVDHHATPAAPARGWTPDLSSATGGGPHGPLALPPGSRDASALAPTPADAIPLSPPRASAHLGGLLPPPAGAAPEPDAGGLALPPGVARQSNVPPPPPSVPPPGETWGSMTVLVPAAGLPGPPAAPGQEAPAETPSLDAVSAGPPETEPPMPYPDLAGGPRGWPAPAPLPAPLPMPPPPPTRSWDAAHAVTEPELPPLPFPTSSPSAWPPPFADPPFADPPFADPPVADPPVADRPVADPPSPGAVVATWAEPVSDAPEPRTGGAIPARLRAVLPERLAGGRGQTGDAAAAAGAQPANATYARSRTGGRRVLVGGFGGGGGRTTVAAGLGLAMAAHHGHRVVAVDASPDQCGLLAHRVGLVPPGVGLRELAGARPPVSSLQDVRRYLASDRSGGLEVLAGLRDLVGPGLLPEELAWALDLLGHWYPVVVADAPPGWSQPVPATLLARADQLVLTVRASETEIAGADDALTALAAAGRPDLAATVIVAVVETYPSRLGRSARMRLDHLEDRAYITVPVPFDAALADSRPINWFRLRRRTRFAFQRLAGAVATAPLPGSQPAMALARPALTAAWSPGIAAHP